MPHIVLQIKEATELVSISDRKRREAIFHRAGFPLKFREELKRLLKRTYMNVNSVEVFHGVFMIQEQQTHICTIRSVRYPASGICHYSNGQRKAKVKAWQPVF